MSQIVVTLPGLVLDNTAYSDGFQLSDIEGWLDTVAPRDKGEEREWGHGDYSQSDWYTDARYVTVTGIYQSYADPDGIFAAREALESLHELTGFPLTVTDPSGTRTAVVNLASKISWNADYAPGCARFEFTLKADDPRKYGVRQVASTGVPTAGEGIADPVDDPVSEGAPGNLARVTVTNGGRAPSEPVIRVTGAVSDGFELRHLESGRVVRVTRPILPGQVITVDHSAGEVWIDGQSALSAAYMPVAEWFQVPPDATATFQWAPLGTVEGAPTMTVEFAEASW